MMFRLKAALRNGKTLSARWRAALVAPAALAGLLVADAALADMRTAVVPKRIIYPGEEIQAGQLEVVEVTNPNIVKGFAESISDVSGLVTKRTLLPGRVILVSALREPFLVNRGSTVQMVFDNGSLVIRASGTPLQDAAVGELIRIRNKDTGVIVSGTVMADGTVHVVAK
ncbi:flagellar basal body P-ring formation protein FlgA [Shinella yambaruensis]|nr:MULTISPECIES: flagellar basal body P-ring formation chaperone FlgA [Shinella]MCJ8026123.1 flagellar basal body P-ring formation protein FlgA [Shinella yambaruensis]MCO5136890.1 flagellar basal body P-ring formation protein FlgA [Shinella sp.]MCU7978155.1 flagellar basal body P-ring formation protein FlgA [Shinella yambaruensis]MCW5706614.1 flagellar basal body P-ring formation protein FlgA [Shinella sp.]MDC7253433.1 flagellar basal body P-ring formation protein FlgA [Shinella sp. YE25]